MPFTRYNALREITACSQILFHPHLRNNHLLQVNLNTLQHVITLRINYLNLKGQYKSVLNDQMLLPIVIPCVEYFWVVSVSPTGNLNLEKFSLYNQVDTESRGHFVTTKKQTQIFHSRLKKNGKIYVWTTVLSLTAQSVAASAIPHNFVSLIPEQQQLVKLCDDKCQK